MSVRSTFALLLAVLLVAACGALFFWDGATAAAAFLALLAGALAARLFPAAAGKAEELTPAAPVPVAGARDVAAGALLEATMESMREGVLIVDAGTRVIASNHAARQIFLEGGEELSSRRLNELRLSDVTRHPSIHAAFQEALERGERAEVKVETQTAGRRVFDLRVAPLRRPGAERGAIGVFFDITRLERLELVRQEFLSNVSHELRTPLTAILTYVETLEEGGIDDDANNRQFLSVIRRNAARMHTLIDDILELSAIEAGTAPVEIGPVRLHPLVNDVFTALGARAEERGVRLGNEVGAEVYVRADARRLEQILTNLVDNAVKFNREGGEVSITHERTSQHDRISVSDTGEGIAPEHIARIFERFYRVDRARSRALGGTGLGLAIVKHLARAHGGEAAVRSTPGRGSTFTLELPSEPQGLASDAAKKESQLQ